MLLCLPLLLAACGSQKVALQDSNSKKVQSTASGAATSSFSFMEKVNDNKVSAENIVADLTFSATMGSKDVSVPGSLHMRKDKVIRLQLFIPIIRTEVGRLEFTPDYVLIVDRMHKQYVKEDYNKLDFLRDNGLNFYSLQALFWNQLFLPGTKSIGENDLQKFTANVNVTTEYIPVSLKEGNMSYLWNVNRLTGLISDALVTYTANSGKSALTWKYSDFRAVGAKQFPANEEFSFQTTASKKVQKTTVVLDMDGIKTTDKWETETEVSSKYKKIEANDIFGKLFDM